MPENEAQPAKTQSLTFRGISTDLVARLKIRQIELGRESGHAVSINDIGEYALRRWLESGGQLPTGVTGHNG